jgi:hypothetical protein
MKNNRLKSAIALLGIAVTSTLLLAGCGGSGNDLPQAGPITNAAVQKTEKVVQYTCSMHADVVQDKAGTCPKCGMKLVEKK